MSTAVRRIHAAGVIVIAATMLAACGGNDETSGPGEVAGPDELESAAQDEGQVIFYSSVEESASQELADAFNETYGIDAQVVRLTSSDLAQRFAAEAEAGAPEADLILISRTGFTAEATDNGWLTPIADAGLPDFPGDLPEQFVFPDEYTAAVAIQPAGIAYNTELVAPEDVPETWEDLLDPRWKGQIGVPDPESSSSYIGEWFVIGQAIGADFLADMGAQDLTVYASGVPAAAAVAAGEETFNVMGLASHVEGPQAEGAPIDFVVPELTSGAEVVVGISADAASPNAARLLAQYVLSPEGSQVLSDAAGAVSPYDAEGLPSEYVSPDLEVASNDPDQVLTPLRGG